MELFENLFKVLIPVFGIILTIIKIVDINSKSSHNILKDFEVLDKATENGIDTKNIITNIERTISKKYTKIEKKSKRNWKIISGSLVVALLMSLHIKYIIDIKDIETMSSIWFALEFGLVSILFLIFIIGIINPYNDQ
jgi:hypothetical protein